MAQPRRAHPLHQIGDQRQWLPDRIDRPTTCAPPASAAATISAGSGGCLHMDVHAAIARAGGDLFGAVGMAVQPRLADQNFSRRPSRAD
jgi:hypothetical protein